MPLLEIWHRTLLWAKHLERTSPLVRAHVAACVRLSGVLIRKLFDEVSAKLRHKLDHIGANSTPTPKETHEP